MKLIIKFASIFSVLYSMVAVAAGQAFSQKEFDNLNKLGKPVFIHIHATWCPVCKAQDTALSKLMGASQFKNVTFLEVDFDSQKKVVSELRASSQSTLIAFKHGQEVARLIGETKPASIEALIKKIE